MQKNFLINSFGWGFILWLIGYILGIILFMAVPPSMIGWVIMPIGIAITLWVLFKKVHGADMVYYLKIGLIWTITAIVLDYLFLVSLFKPADGYYKLDVYLYYALTFVLPLVAGYFKIKKSSAG
jgi:hypothetical protein